MSFFALLRVETGRLLRSRLTWLLCALALLAPLLGHSVYRPAIGDSMASLYLANPMAAGGFAGALLFAMLLLTALERPRRSGMTTLTQAVRSPLALHTATLLAVLVTAVLTALAAGLLYLPYTWWKLDIVFSLSDYALAVGLLYLSGPVMGALAAAILDQLTGRLDVSLLAVGAALLFSQGQWCRDLFLAQWSVPLVPALSDAFGSAVVWRTALYSRLVWLCFLGGGWLLSLLCVRQYGKGLVSSLLCHCRRAVLPLVAAALLACGGLLWRAEPFVDHSPADWASQMDSQPQRYSEYLLLTGTELKINIKSYLLGTLSGSAVYQLQNTSGGPQELYFELNPGYTVRAVTANGQTIPVEDLHNDFIASRELRCTLPAEKEITLRVEYDGSPKIWSAQGGQLSGAFISRRGLELSSTHLSPTVLGCVGMEDENTPVSLHIRLSNSLTPVSSGAVERLTDNGDGTTDWRVTDRGTDRLQLYAGDYIYRALDTGAGPPIDFWYSRVYAPLLEGGGAMDLMEKAVQYCTAHYGPRSSDPESSFKIIQTTVFMFGGFANRGISGMGESYFSDRNLSDGDKGVGSAEVLAHEIIHQWWGLGAQMMDPEDSYWTDEGVTTYATYRLMREVMGEDYAQTHYVDKWEAAVVDAQANFYQRHPEYLSRLPERYQNDVLSAFNAVNWYDGTALMLYHAEETLGTPRLDQVLAGLYTEGGTELPPFITLGDFLSDCGLEEGEIDRE